MEAMTVGLFCMTRGQASALQLIVLPGAVSELQYAAAACCA